MFKNFLGRLGRYLYLNYSKPDIVALTREQMKSVNWVEPPLGDLSPEEQKVLFNEAHQVVITQVFPYILDSIVKEQTELAMQKAVSFEEVMFARATINGVELVREKMQFFESMQEKEKEEITDPYAVV